MIYIRIELWPYGCREQARLLGEGIIVNDGTGTPMRGNYWARLWGKRGARGNLQEGGAAAAMRATRVENFPRRSRNVWALLLRVLRQCERA